MKFHVTTFGCQMNEHDSERMKGMLESLEQYVKRLRDLEQIATRHDGVDKVYAMQAGREIRVMVLPGALDDDGAVLLSHEIAREIERELEYPGQIKVTVIRESRSVEYAR
jgi:ribonuclease Y